MNNSDLKIHINDAVREYRLSRRNHASTYIRMARRFSTIPGISRTRALAIAAEVFPGSHADFIKRQNAGESLPILFPREGEGYEQRRAQALARGGIIS